MRFCVVGIDWLEEGTAIQLMGLGHDLILTHARGTAKENYIHARATILCVPASILVDVARAWAAGVTTHPEKSHLLVVRSDVPPGTCEELERTVREEFGFRFLYVVHMTESDGYSAAFVIGKDRPPPELMDTLSRMAPNVVCTWDPGKQYI